jgi:hypothetical protein
MSTPEITIIADNGGGLTLQVTHKGLRYQRSDDAKQVARLFAEAEGSSDLDLSEWEGNQAEEYGWLDPDPDAIRNGGYRVMSLADILESSESDSWANVCEVKEALSRLALENDGYC